jgi:hypothetical protein
MMYNISQESGTLESAVIRLSSARVSCSLVAESMPHWDPSPIRHEDMCVKFMFVRQIGLRQLDKGNIPERRKREREIQILSNYFPLTKYCYAVNIPYGAQMMSNNKPSPLHHYPI